MRHIVFLALILVLTTQALASKKWNPCDVFLTKDEASISHGSTRIGFLYFITPYEDEPGSLLIGNLWTEPEYFDQGVSTALLTKVLTAHPHVSTVTGVLADTNARIFAETKYQRIEELVENKDGLLDTYLHPAVKYKAQILSNELQNFSSKSDFLEHCFRLFSDKAKKEVLDSALRATYLYRTLSKLGFTEICHQKCLWGTVNADFVIQKKNQ